jgi:uncharacterized membrane protein YfcA
VTIEASVPSTSVKTALVPGLDRSGSSTAAARPLLSGAAVTEPSIVAVLSGWLPKLAAIATAAGIFSGLFGVGGGTVIVPLLILWLGYGEREATGTSLAAIAVIAALAAMAQGLYGNVDVVDGVLIGIPAVGGVLIGTAVQQRIPQRAVSLLFAGLLVVIAIELILP